MQNEWESDVVCFTTYVQTCFTTNQVVAGCRKMLQINLGEISKIAFLLVLWQCFKTSCMFLLTSCKPQLFKIKEGCSGLVNLTETEYPKIESQLLRFEPRLWTQLQMDT